MNKITTCVAAIAALIAAPAFAADMGAPPPAPVYNWTGWYAGVNAGASFGNVKTDFNVAPVFISGPAIGIGPVVDQISPGLGFSDRSSPSGFIGGGQIGYNWQYSPLIVVGLEADIQGALERETNNLMQDFSRFFSGNGGCFAFFGCSSLASYTTQIDWFGTVRGRIGYLWGDGAVLTYFTGGLAYGEVKITGTNNVNGVLVSQLSSSRYSFIQTFGQTHVNTGWVVGFGTEGKLLIPGWTYKIECLYMDLGHLDTTGVTSGAPTSAGFPLSGGQVTTHSHFTDGILRAGVNYQFH